jgi:hypothetical protein
LPLGPGEPSRGVGLGGAVRGPEPRQPPGPFRDHDCPRRVVKKGKCCRIFCGGPPDRFVAPLLRYCVGEMLQDFLRRLPGTIS